MNAKSNHCRVKLFQGKNAPEWIYFTFGYIRYSLHLLFKCVHLSTSFVLTVKRERKRERSLAIACSLHGTVCRRAAIKIPRERREEGKEKSEWSNLWHSTFPQELETARTLEQPLTGVHACSPTSGTFNSIVHPLLLKYKWHVHA